MPRTVKAPDERRSELITAAQQLFYTKGYERTAISDIVKAVGVAHGTFYYYFGSKLAVLEAIVDEVSDYLLAEMQAIVADDSLSAILKWRKIIQVSNSWKAARKTEMLEIGRLVMLDENLLLRHKLQSRAREVGAGEMARIIEQGVGEGVFNVQHAEDAAEIVMAIIAALREAIVPLLLDAAEYDDPAAIVVRKTTAAQTAVERVLAAPAGSLKVIDDDFVTTWFG